MRVRLKYPYSKSERIYDGKYHDIDIKEVSRIGNTNYYFVEYNDYSVGLFRRPQVFSTLLIKEGDTIKKVPLDDYSVLDQLLLNEENSLSSININEFVGSNTNIDTLQIQNARSVINDIKIQLNGNRNNLSSSQGVYASGGNTPPPGGNVGNGENTPPPYDNRNDLSSLHGLYASGGNTPPPPPGGNGGNTPPPRRINVDSIALFDVIVLEGNRRQIRVGVSNQYLGDKYGYNDPNKQEWVTVTQEDVYYIEEVSDNPKLRAHYIYGMRMDVKGRFEVIVLEGNRRQIRVGVSNQYLGDKYGYNDPNKQEWVTVTQEDVDYIKREYGLEPDYIYGMRMDDKGRFEVIVLEGNRRQIRVGVSNRYLGDKYGYNDPNKQEWVTVTQEDVDYIKREYGLEPDYIYTNRRNISSGGGGGTPPGPGGPPTGGSRGDNPGGDDKISQLKFDGPFLALKLPDGSYNIYSYTKDEFKITNDFKMRMDFVINSHNAYRNLSEQEIRQILNNPHSSPMNIKYIVENYEFKNTNEVSADDYYILIGNKYEHHDYKKLSSININYNQGGKSKH